MVVIWKQHSWMVRAQGLSRDCIQAVHWGVALSKLKLGRVYFQAHSGDCWQASEDLPGLFTWLPVCLISLLYGLFTLRLPECHHGTLSRAAFPHDSWLPSERANEGERTYRHGNQCLFYNLMSKVASHHCYCVLFTRIKSPGWPCAFLIEQHWSVMWNCYLTSYHRLSILKQAFYLIHFWIRK